MRWKKIDLMRKNALNVVNRGTGLMHVQMTMVVMEEVGRRGSEARLVAVGLLEEEEEGEGGQAVSSLFL